MRTSRGRSEPVRIDAGMPVRRFEQLTSTSGFARGEIAAGRLGAEPVAFVAARQTAGVGRFGRPWESPEGGLWMTLAWPHAEASLERTLEGLGLRVGVACLRAVRRMAEGAPVEPFVWLKWPNDVLVRGKKVLGVLTEVVRGPAPGWRPWILVGVGVNANNAPPSLPEEVRSYSTTLSAELGRPVDLATLERELLAELRAALSAHTLARETIVEATERLHGLGMDTAVSLPDGTKIAGVLTGLNEHGMAILEVEGRVFVPPLGSVIMNPPAPPTPGV